MTRLSSSVLAASVRPALTDTQVQLPGYSREDVGIGIVHLGIGAFHRAHQAIYTEDLLCRGGGNWGICGVSLRRPLVRYQLMPQDGLYTSVEKQGDSTSMRIVGAVQEVLVASDDPAAVIARFADPGVAVVTLTVTEKGYCLDQAGQVDAEHEDIRADLAQPDRPVSAVGYICAGLQARRRAGLPGLTVISCDNLAHNGRKLQAAVAALAARLDPQLASWIEAQCRFPDTMVDKIVPAASTALLAEVEQAIGCRDEAAVVGEPFRQWVIERKFAGEMPAWDSVGAAFVDDVAPFEAMKLRLLNTSHSTIAYLGCLAGWQTVAEAMAQPPLRQLVAAMMEQEIEPCLHIPAGFDVRAYQQQLLSRFANTALQHATRQIAMDGSQKLVQRLLPTLQWQLAHDGPIERLSLGLAAWIQYTRRAELEDPLAATIHNLHSAAGEEPAAYLPALLSLREVFAAELADNARLRACLLAHLVALQEQGVMAALKRLG